MPVALISAIKTTAAPAFFISFISSIFGNLGKAIIGKGRNQMRKPYKLGGILTDAGLSSIQPIPKTKAEKTAIQSALLTINLEFLYETNIVAPMISIVPKNLFSVSTSPNKIMEPKKATAGVRRKMIVTVEASMCLRARKCVLSYSPKKIQARIIKMIWAVGMESGKPVRLDSNRKIKNVKNAPQQLKTNEKMRGLMLLTAITRKRRFKEVNIITDIRESHNQSMRTL